MTVPFYPEAFLQQKVRVESRTALAKDNPPKLHGTYYRWTGAIDGKRTTRTISKEMARECERRIENYRTLQKKIDELVEKALLEAPWTEE